MACLLTRRFFVPLLRQKYVETEITKRLHSDARSMPSTIATTSTASTAAAAAPAGAPAEITEEDLYRTPKFLQVVCEGSNQSAVHLDRSRVC